MTDLDLDNLEALAKAANGDEWRPVPMGLRVSEDGLIIESIGAEIHPHATPYAEVVRIGVIGKPRTAHQVWADARYIAAANPAVVLALIERVRELEAIAPDAAARWIDETFPTDEEGNPL